MGSDEWLSGQGGGRGEEQEPLGGHSCGALAGSRHAATRPWADRLLREARPASGRSGWPEGGPKWVYWTPYPRAATDNYGGVCLGARANTQRFWLLGARSSRWGAEPRAPPPTPHWVGLWVQAAPWDRSVWAAPKAGATLSAPLRGSQGRKAPTRRGEEGRPEEPCLSHESPAGSQ